METILPELYKRAFNSDVLLWRVLIVTEDNIHYRLKYEHGTYKGKKTISYSDCIEPKNIGKKNATTSEEQANKEAHSAWERQRKKGYKTFDEVVKDGKYKSLFDALNKYLPKYNTDVNNVCKPMKCQKFQLGKMHYWAILQPKINGVRCIIRYTEIKEGEGLFETVNKQAVILSKEGLRYNIKHIEDCFTNFYENYSDCQNVVFDGELYIKDKPVTTIGGAARNKDNEFHKDLKFVCFDLAIPDISNQRRDAYRDYLFELINCYKPISINDHSNFSVTTRPVICLNSIEVHSDEEVLEYRDDCIKNGYEGCVVRDKDAEYCFGQRPKTIMKCKVFDDAEFEILDIKCRGNAYDKVGFTIIYLLQNDINELQFECNGTGSVEDKLEIYNNKDKYIGKLATVKFYERTKNGLPFHANVIATRDYETPTNN